MQRLLLVLCCLIACSSFVPKEEPRTPMPLVIPVQLKSEQKPVSFSFLEPEPISLSPLEPKVERLLITMRQRANQVEYTWLTRICVSEGGFNYIECEKILQTLENMKLQSRSSSLLDIMYIQSAHITRRKPFTSARQVWVSYLPMQGKEPPSKGWVECMGKDTPKGCTGTWSATVDQWIAFREKVKNLYYSGVIPNLVPGLPIQWGGNMDYWRGVDRAFCPLNNDGSSLRNTYWGNPKNPANYGKCLSIEKDKITHSKTLSAAIASGRDMQKVRIQTLLGQATSPVPSSN
jgi:hypothetical protein